MTVLIVTAPEDASATRVADLLDERGVRSIWVNLADFPSRVSFAATTGPGESWAGRLDTEWGLVDLESVSAVYYRKPRSFHFPGELSEQARGFARREARMGFGGYLLSLPARWVSHPSAIADGENKPAQLRVAAQVGLNVPPTLITNDPEAAKAFAARVGTVVYKPFAPPFFRDGDTTLQVHTNVVDPEVIGEDVRLTANLFQQWVPKAHEVRATVVGDRVFAVAIHAGSEAARVDWRTDYDSLTYEVVGTPPDIAKAMTAYLQVFGLAFGAFDFAVDHDGKWWFLECNPNGQWGWIEAETGLPIASALADALTETSP